jgi:hypothetical protein
MINSQISWRLQHHQKLLGSQFGFRKGKSCTDNLRIPYEEIINAFIKDKGTTVAFLDMKAAYDNVLPDILDEKFKNVRVSL